jgi:uncharacterized membrane protein HdeD (DUF308 family)
MTILATTTAPIELAPPVRRGLAVRGGLLLLFGLVEGVLILLAFRIPLASASILVMVMAGFLLTDGITSLFGAVRAPDQPWWPALHGVTGVVAGALVLLLAHPWSINVFGAWAIVTGVLTARDARLSRPVRVAVAVLAVALGLMAVASAFRYPAHALLTISVYGVIAGIILLWVARSGQTVPGGARLR